MKERSGDIANHNPGGGTGTWRGFGLKQLVRALLQRDELRVK